MTDEPWQDPTDGWDSDETQTQWVRSGPPEAAPPDAAPPEGAREWSSPADSGAQPQWAEWEQPADGTGWAAPSAAEAISPSHAARAKSLATLGVLRLAAQVACPLLLLVGLSVNEHGTDGWHAYTAWALFAVVCALLQLAPVAGKRLGLTDESSWSLGAVGTAGLVAYWVIIVLPGASSNTGFVQTLAVGLAVIGLWLSPGRRL